MAEPNGTAPSGVVTFMFTDIESSTELIARLGARAPAALAAHDRIVRAAVRLSHGYEVRTEGDSFFLAFARPTEAINAAIAIQRSLAAYPWPADGEIRVRIGMHTGEAHRHGNGFVGVAVHLAARIASAASGGQVLVSSATADMVAGRLLPEARLVDRGWRSFRGFPTPERVIELLHPALHAPSAMVG